MARDVSIAVIARDLAGATFAKVGAEAETLGKRLDGLGGKIGSKLADAAKASAKAGAYVSASAVAAAGGLAVMGVKGAAALETTTTSFTALLGSSQKATQQIAQLQTYAAKTPFSQQDVLGYAQQYYALAGSVGMSKDNVTQFLDSVGNLGAVTGASTEGIHNAVTAIGQIGSSGKVTLDNLNQISEAFPGFNGAAAIASATGQTTAQVMAKISSGTLDAKTGVAALITGMQKFPGAAGAMEKQSETLTGLWSTFTDTVQIALTQAFEPMIPAIKGLLGQVTPVISSVLKTVAPVVTEFVGALVPVVVPLVKVLGGVLSNVLEALMPLIRALVPVVKPLGDAFVAIVEAAKPFIGLFADVIAKLLPPLLKVVVPIANAFGDMASRLWDALGPVLPVIAKAIGQVADVLGKILPVVSPIIGLLGTVFAKVLATLAPLFVTLVRALQPVIKALAGAFLTVIRALLPTLPSIASSLGLLALSLAKMLVAVTPLLPPIAALMSLIVRLGGNTIAFLLSMVAKLVAVLAAVLSPAIRAVSGVFTHFGAIARAVWHGIVVAVTAAVHGVHVAISKTLGAIGQAWSSAWGAVKRTTSSAIGAVVGFVRDLPDKIAGLGSKMFGAGKHLLGSLLDGIRHVLGEVGGFVTDLGKTIANGIIGAINAALALPWKLPKITIYNPIPGADDFHIGGQTILPRIPKFARGGMTTGPTPFLAGDNPGGREMVLPMSDPRTIDTLAAALGKAGGRGGGGKIAEHLTIVEASNPRETARQIARYQARRAAV